MNWSDTDSIITENQRRLEVIRKPYDPLVGTEYSEVIKRFRIDIPDAPIPTMYLPIEMYDEDIVQLLLHYKTLKKTCRAIFGGAATERKKIKTYQQLLRIRSRYDFEFWCAYEIKIKWKGRGKRGPLILNRAQRFYLETLERLRKSNESIEVILLKARQWGGSTMTQFYMFWIQKMHKAHWNSVICGDVEKQSKVVLSMLEKAARDYDTFIDDGRPTIVRPFGRTDSIREIVGRDCTISVGSFQKPDKLRCEDISLCHLTEVGIWKATEGKSPEDLIETIEGSMLNGPYTLFAIESTAKGQGNYFHNTWLDAVAGKNGFTPVFVPWYIIDKYSKTLTCAPERFIATMTAYDKFLFEQGATLEAINWYKHKARKMDDFRMKSEYPTTADEAFQSTGCNFFAECNPDRLYDTCEDPKYVGDVYSHNDNDNKELFLSDLYFNENKLGNFKIWSMPDTKVNMRNRYLVTVDLGKGMSADADNSIITVWDRYWQQEGEDGYPEIVAEWEGHLQTDLLAWKCAQIGSYYNNALLVIESNTLETSKEDRFRAVLDEIKDYYPNLYKRSTTNNGKIDVGNTGSFRYGWNTNHSSKEEICGNLAWAIREGMYVERNREAVHEIKIFERRPDGELGNAIGKGNHDDHVITRGMGIHFCYRKMDKPVIIDAKMANQVVISKTLNDMTI